VFVISMRVDIGKKPAVIVSPCEACARAFFNWMRGQNFVAWFDDVKHLYAYSPDEESAGHAEAWLDSFRRWRAVAAPGCDHLEVMRPRA